MKNLLSTKFKKYSADDHSGLNGVQMEKLFKELGYNVTRKSIDALAKAGVIKKPSEMNYVKGNGRRVEYDIESAIDLVIYCMTCNTLQGMGKGFATFDKHLLLREAKKIAEAGTDNMRDFIMYSNIASLLSAKDVIPSTMPIAQRVACANSVRGLLFKATILYKFLILWLKFGLDSVLNDWKVLKNEVISKRNVKQFSKNYVKQILDIGASSKSTGAMKKADEILESVNGDVRAAIDGWADIICVLDNNNGIVGKLAHDWLKKKYNINCFGTDDDWLLAFNILRSK